MKYWNVQSKATKFSVIGTEFPQNYIILKLTFKRINGIYSVDLIFIILSASIFNKY